VSFRSIKDELLQYFHKKVVIFYIVILVVSLVLFARLFYLQIVEYDSFLTLSNTNRIRITKVLADRGFILDRTGKILVKNAPTYELVVTKEDVQDIDALLEDISKHILLNISEAKKLINKSYFYQQAIIARGLTFEQVAFFLEHSSDFIGLDISLKSMREYYDGTAVSQLVGYLGEASDEDIEELSFLKSGDTIGKTGIENFYESYLRGTDGARQVQVDSFGRVHGILISKDPIPGQNITLTIDYELQKFITDKLVDKRGSAIVMDIRDNSVLSIVSTPTYNLRFFSPFILDADWHNLLTDKNKPLLNRPLEGAYPPGSIYKVLVALAALKEELITPQTKVKCTGNYILSRKFNYHCWKRSGHGNINLKEALARSCDVYFYTIGKLLEIDKLEEYSRLFSLGKITGIDLPNERSGFFPSRKWKQETKNEVWFPGETIITSIGQGYIINTPMQVAVMMSGIFNGGKIYKPRVVETISSNVDNKTIEFESELIKTIDIPKQYSDLLMEALVDSVHAAGGTSRRATVYGKKKMLGGKTSTAQVVSLRKTEGMKDEDIPELWRDHSWFTAIFPIEEPKYVLVVMVENGGSGGRTSAPLGGQIVRKMMDLGYVKTD